MSPRSIADRAAPHRQHTARPPADRGSVSVEMALGYVPLMVLAALAVVACLRLASAAIDVHSAAAAAARQASLAHSPAEARLAGGEAASVSLTGRPVTCQPPTVTVDAGNFVPGGQVTAAVGCTVRLEDLYGLGLPGAVTIRATSRQPLDTYGAQP